MHGAGDSVREPLPSGRRANVVFQNGTRSLFERARRGEAKLLGGEPLASLLVLVRVSPRALSVFILLDDVSRRRRRRPGDARRPRPRPRDGATRTAAKARGHNVSARSASVDARRLGRRAMRADVRSRRHQMDDRRARRRRDRSRRKLTTRSRVVVDGRGDSPEERGATRGRGGVEAQVERGLRGTKRARGWERRRRSRR